MYQDIAQLHEEVLEFLLEKRKGMPDLCFTLRREPKGLAKKYWFMGNEFSLFFSFWKGIDWMDNVPPISITINTKGELYINLTANTSDEIATFFENVVKSVGKFTKDKKREGNYWFRLHTREDWRVGLATFIDFDRVIIDSLLMQQGEYIGDFTNIEKQNFEKDLKIVEILRANTVYVTPKNQQAENEKLFGKTLKLNTIQLSNIKHFDTISVDLNKRVTCLIGENGSGKTTILSSIALALTGTGILAPTPNDIYFDLKQRKNILLKITNLVNGKPQYAESGEINLDYSIDEGENQKSYKNTIEFVKEDKKNTITALDADIKSIISLKLNNKDVKSLIGTVIAFPQGKGFEIKDIELEEEYFDPLELLPIVANAHIDQHLENLAKWLGKKYDIYIKSRDNKDKTPVELVFSIISKIISDTNNKNEVQFDWDNFTRDKDEKAVVSVIKPDNPNGVYLDLLSEGYKNLFYWIGGIVSRLYKLNDFYNTSQQFKHLYKEDIRQHSGVVLIDEIDTYLHPKWQRNILKVLVEEFPKLQFVVTTHSPLVIGHLFLWKKTNVFKIQGNEAIPKSHFYGRNPIDLFLEFYGVETRPKEIQEKIDNLYYAFEAENISEAKLILTELTEILGSDDAIVNEFITSLTLLEELQ